MEKKRSKAIHKFLLIEIEISSVNKTKFGFPDIQNLAGKKIVALEARNDMTATPTGRSVINGFVFGKAFLTLKGCNNSEDIAELPLVSIDPTKNSGLIREIAEKQIDVSNSFITVGSTAGLNANESFLIGVYYED